MTTATPHPRTEGQAGGRKSVEKRVLNLLFRLPKQHLNRLVQLLQDWPNAVDEDEYRRIAKAIHEILFPESIGGIGDLTAGIPPDATNRVHAYRAKIGAQIRSCRLQKSLTQTALAKLTGLPQTHISRLERGKHTASHLTIKRIAEALGLRPCDLDPGFPDGEGQIGAWG